MTNLPSSLLIKDFKPLSIEGLLVQLHMLDYELAGTPKKARSRQRRWTYVIVLVRL